MSVGISKVVLPDVLLGEIFHYLKDVSDRMEFARVNKLMSSQFMKQAREISLKKNISCQQFYQSEAYRSKILELIQDPQKQLFINSLPLSGLNIKRESLPDTLPSLACLSCHISDFISILHHKIKAIDKIVCNLLGHLSLEEQALFRRVLFSYPVKNLEITYLNQIPVILQLNTLKISDSSISARNFHLPSFTNLKSLSLLNCNLNDADILLFGEINELQLIECLGITDISCLNNNLKVLIRDCDNISDYSKSFEFSEVIEITTTSCPYSPIDVSHLKKAKHLSVQGCRMTLMNGISLGCNFLRSLTISEFPEHFILPTDHHLSHLVIRNCVGFQSCENIGSIHKIEFSSLLLTSLNGFGPGNHLVELTSCNEVLDFRPLRNCKKVSIRNCLELYDARQLKGVKELEVLWRQESVVIPNFEGVTRLELCSAQVLDLSQISTIKTVVLTRSQDYKKEMLLHLCECHHIQTIIVESTFGSGPFLVTEFQRDAKFKLAINQTFIVERTFRSITEVLIRKFLNN